MDRWDDARDRFLSHLSSDEAIEAWAIKLEAIEDAMRTLYDAGQAYGDFADLLKARGLNDHPAILGLKTILEGTAMPVGAPNVEEEAVLVTVPMMRHTDISRGDAKHYHSMAVVLHDADPHPTQEELGDEAMHTLSRMALGYLQQHSVPMGPNAERLVRVGFHESDEIGQGSSRSAKPIHWHMLDTDLDALDAAYGATDTRGMEMDEPEPCAAEISRSLYDHFTASGLFTSSGNPNLVPGLEFLTNKEKASFFGSMPEGGLAFALPADGFSANQLTELVRGVHQQFTDWHREFFQARVYNYDEVRNSGWTIPYQANGQDAIADLIAGREDGSLKPINGKMKRPLMRSPTYNLSMSYDPEGGYLYFQLDAQIFESHGYTMANGLKMLVPNASFQAVPQEESMKIVQEELARVQRVLPAQMGGVS
jgi:hypothetical protein